VAEQYGGRCNLRFDDTNPLTEGVEYVDPILQDVKWLGFSFGDHALYASDYFQEMYQLALELVADGKAYVDDLSEEEIKVYRGSLGEPGRPSPCRERTVEENLARFAEMRAGNLSKTTGNCTTGSSKTPGSPSVTVSVGPTNTSSPVSTLITPL
jgi:glutaminyl-tRNA synthetase